MAPPLSQSLSLLPFLHRLGSGVRLKPCGLMRDSFQVATLSLQKTQPSPWLKPNHLLENITQLGKRESFFHLKFLITNWVSIEPYSLSLVSQLAHSQRWQFYTFPSTSQPLNTQSPLSDSDLDGLHCQKPSDTRSLTLPPPSLTLHSIYLYSSLLPVIADEVSLPI